MAAIPPRSQKQAAVSLECQAALEAFERRQLAMADQVNSAAQTRIAFRSLVVRGVEGASARELGLLADRYNLAVKKQGRSTEAATRALKIYATRRATCAITRAAPVACRNTFRRMRNSDILDKKVGIPLVKETQSVMGAFSILVRGGPRVLSVQQNHNVLLAMFDQVNELSKRHSAYVKKSNVLVKQYDKTAKNCVAGAQDRSKAAGSARRRSTDPRAPALFAMPVALTTQLCKALRWALFEAGRRDRHGMCRSGHVDGLVPFAEGDGCSRLALAYDFLYRQRRSRRSCIERGDRSAPHR